MRLWRCSRNHESFTYRGTNVSIASNASPVSRVMARETLPKVDAPLILRLRGRRFVVNARRVQTTEARWKHMRDYSLSSDPFDSEPAGGDQRYPFRAQHLIRWACTNCKMC